MSFETSESFEVRGNEIGFTGFVQPGTFLRYSEWARWTMFRDPRVQTELKIGSGVARAQRLELLHDLAYPSTIKVLTTVSRLGRTSIDMLHRMVREEDGVTVARSSVTIVQIGPNGPMPIDPSVASLVTPGVAPTEMPYEPGPAEFETTIVARPSDQDQFRHVNQARYADFADDVRHFAAMAGNPAGFDGPLGAIAVNYMREVKAGTVLRAELRRGSGSTRSLRLVDSATGIESTQIVIAPRS